MLSANGTFESGLAFSPFFLAESIPGEGTSFVSDLVFLNIECCRLDDAS